MNLTRRARLAVLLTFVVLPLLLVAACSGGGGGGGVTVRLSEFKFEPNTFTAKAGQPLRLTLQNAGTVVHDFNVKDLDVHSPKVQPGQSVTFEFTPSKTGTFDVQCDEAGHEPGGMKGALTVQ